MSQNLTDKSDKYKDVEYATYGVYRFGKKVQSGLIEIKGEFVGFVYSEGSSPLNDEWRAKSRAGELRHFVISEFEVIINRRWIKDAVRGTSTNPFTRFEKYLYDRKNRKGT
jgi:hypothetical protein